VRWQAIDILLAWSFFIMRRLLLVHGMKRAGNHAIVNWVQGQSRFAFFNNVIRVAYLLNGEMAMPEPQPFGQWLSRHVWRERLRCVTRFQWTDLYRLAPPLQSAIVSLEDLDLDVRPFRDPPVPVTHVLLIRDAANLFASRIRKAATRHRPRVYPRGYDQYMQRAVCLWKSHAREFLRITRRLEPCVTVYYDGWLTDESHRRRVSRQLGLTFSDAGMQRVSGVGGGSSFDGTRFSGRAKTMNLLRRADDLSPHERTVLDRVLQDSELKELNAAIAETNCDHGAERRP
jgi:hypothetical protein